MAYSLEHREIGGGGGKGDNHVQRLDCLKYYQMAKAWEVGMKC